MTEFEINLKVAELVGTWRFTNPMPKTPAFDYCNDRNAMAEALATLTDAEWGDFVMAAGISGVIGPFAAAKTAFLMPVRQQAEAFLRAKGINAKGN